MFFVSLITITSLGLWFDYRFNINFFTIAFIATLIEQFSIIGIDNFIVPIAAAVFFNLFIIKL